MIVVCMTSQKHIKPKIEGCQGLLLTTFVSASPQDLQQDTQFRRPTSLREHVEDGLF